MTHNLTQLRQTPPIMPPVIRTGMVGHGLDPAGETLHIAAVHVPVDRIAAYSVAGLSEKDFNSTFATAGLFGGAAAFFLVLVYVFGWRDRFLLASGLLGAIALFALIDLKRLKWLTTYTFTLALADGTKRTFATTSEAEAIRLRDLLDARGVPASLR